MRILTISVLFCGLFALLGQSMGYLSLDQVRSVQSILRNQETPPIILQKTKTILYHHYYPWVLKETKEFSKIHRKAIQQIVKPTSIDIYGLQGLSKAIKHYNGTSAFHIYAKPYVQGELYRGLTDSTVLKPYRHSQIISQKNNTIILMQNKQTLVSYSNYWTFDKLLQEKGNRIYSDPTRIEMIRDSVDSMDPDMRRLFYLRYHSFDLSLRYPIAKICELLCISSETYRKRMNYIIAKIRNTSPHHLSSS